jgi:hypothetical protein
VQYGASALHAPVVTASQDDPAMHQHRANRDAALAQTALGFLDGSLQEFNGHLFKPPVMRAVVVTNSR